MKRIEQHRLHRQVTTASEKVYLHGGESSGTYSNYFKMHKVELSGYKIFSSLEHMLLWEGGKERKRQEERYTEEQRRGEGGTGRERQGWRLRECRE